jgi:hypothetical protein
VRVDAREEASEIRLGVSDPATARFSHYTRAQLLAHSLARVYIRAQLHSLHLRAASLSLAMSTAARRRLVRDLKKMQNEPPSGINAAPMEE